MNRFYIKNFGCLSNVHMTEKLKKYLQENGYVPGTEEECERLIVSCCVVTQEEEDRVKQYVESHQDKAVYLTGCISEGIAQTFWHPNLKMANQISQIEKIFPPHREKCFASISYRGDYPLERIPEYISGREKGYGAFVRLLSAIDRETAMDVANSIVGYEFKDPIERYYKVLISAGCVHNCSYCLVKKVKGAYTSRTMEEIMEDIRRGYGMGYRKFILIGDEVSSYGRDLYQMYALPGLLKEIFTGFSDIKIGLRYLEPMILGKIWEDLKPWITDSHIFYLNIPIQSGSEKLLKQMNRYTDIENLKEILKELRKAYTGPLLTHVMVGLPWEDREDIRETRKVMEYFDNTSIHIFSPRKGTRCETERVHPDVQVHFQMIEEKRKGIRAYFLKKRLSEICKKESMKSGNECEYRFFRKDLNPDALEWLKGLSWGKTVEQADIVWMNPEVPGFVIRLRKSEGFYFQFKIKKQDFEWHEISLPIEEEDAAPLMIFAREYAQPMGVVEKRRRYASYNSKIKVYEDEVAHLGEFIEIESTDSSVDDLLEELGISRDLAQKPYGRLLDELGLDVGKEIERCCQRWGRTV